MKKLFSVLLALVLVVSFSLVTSAPVQAAEINVPDDYATIQEAVDAAQDFDTIIVAAGTYVEAVTIDKLLTLQGEDRETTIIKGIPTDPHLLGLLDILADEVTVSGLTIHSEIGAEWTIAAEGDKAKLTDLHVIHDNPAGAAIHIGKPYIGDEYVNGFTFSESTVDSAMSGVFVPSDTRGSNFEVKKVEFATSWTAVELKGIDGAMVTECSFSTAQLPVYISDSDGVEISDNEFVGLIGADIAIFLDPYLGTTVGAVDILRNDISGSTTGIFLGEGLLTVGVSITDNTFQDNDVQVLDATETLNIAQVLANNIFDRAVTVDHDASLLHTIWSKIQDGIDSATEGNTVIVAAGEYIETVTIGAGLDDLTLKGAGPTNTVITNGIKFDTNADDIAGLSILNFTIRGNAGTYGNGVTVGQIGNDYLYDLTFDNNVFDGQKSVGMCSYINPVAGSFTFTNNEVAGYTDWGTIYVGEATLKAGPDGPSLATVSFQGNRIHDNMGSSVVYGNADNLTDQFIIQDNEFRNNGGHEWFWAAIEVRNADNILVENNVFEGSPVGMEEVHGAALYLTNDNDGLFNGDIVGNDFLNNYQAIYVYSGNVSGLRVHFNNFSGNNIAIDALGEANPSGILDATNNWWGNASGPSHSPGSGDPVSANVTYDPWLLEEVVPDVTPLTFDKTLALKDDWTLVSTDKWVESAAWRGVLLAYKYTGKGQGYVPIEDEEQLAKNLEPVEALYVKTEGGGGIGIKYSGGVPVASSKDLEAGWNLISSATKTEARAVLSPLRYVQVGNQQGVALTTLVSQGEFNQHTPAFYLATLDQDDWTALVDITLIPFDGYWVYMNDAKSFGVVPE